MRLACLALFAFHTLGQAAKPNLEVTNAYTRHFLVSFAPPVELPWERILRAHAPSVNFDHLSGAQIGWIKKNPVRSVETLTGYEFCVTVPLDLGLRRSAFWLVSARGVTLLLVSGMRACAEFGPEEKSGFHPQSFNGSILAIVPGQKGGAGAGFVVRTDGTAPTVLPMANRRFTADFGPAGNQRNISCAYSDAGSQAVQGTVDAKARESLQRWFAFRVGQRVYVLAVWKGRDGACHNFYSLFQVDGKLTEVGESGDGCDV